MTEPVVRDPNKPDSVPPIKKPSRLKELFNRLIRRTDDDTLTR